MTDMNLRIDNLVSDLATTELGFPDTFKGKSLPLITITDLDNNSNLILDGEERLSAISYQIDIWDSSDNGKTRHTCEQLAAQISSRLISVNFTRSGAHYIKDPSGLHRKTMTFNGFLDTHTNIIYRRGF
jgi:hypothetical protein